MQNQQIILIHGKNYKQMTKQLLQAAGLGIAMGSGSVAAKAAADRIGPDAEPHGIAELCRELWPEAF